MLATFIYNLFRFSGDFLRLYSILILMKKIKSTKSVSGLSLKTQLLYLLVFITRYLDLFYFQLNSFLRFYNFIMKIVYLITHIYLIYFIRYKYFYSYDLSFDSFNILNCIIPCLILAPFLKPNSTGILHYFIELSYAFSVILESVAILPQLLMLQESGEAESMTSQYILYLGIYRLLYVINWIVKWSVGLGFNHLLIASGVIQTLLYVDFFVVYYKYVFTRSKEKIPSRR